MWVHPFSKHHDTLHLPGGICHTLRRIRQPQPQVFQRVGCRVRLPWPGISTASLGRVLPLPQHWGGLPGGGAPSESFPMPASPIARRPAMLPRSAPLLRWTMRHLPTALCSAEEVPASAMVLETRTFTSCRLRCSPHQTSRASTRSSSGSISYSLQQIRSSSNVITQQGKARHCCMLETPSSAATGCALITRKSGRPCVTLSSGRC